MAATSDYAAMYAAFTSECTRLAERAFAMHCAAGGISRLYLAGRKVGGIWRALDVVDEYTLDDPHWTVWTYVRPEHISPALTVEGMYDVIRGWLRREPMFMFADEPEVL